jgi:hypothetical protein
MTMEFREFPKLARFSRQCVVTEKIDGTNAAVVIMAFPEAAPRFEKEVAKVGDFRVFAQSRTRLITSDDDNFGFAEWVRDNAAELVKLGPGHHFGEWWGSGIQRGYGLPKGERRFSLFNVSRWADDAARPACCHVVPTLWVGEFDLVVRQMGFIMGDLILNGSTAAPGFKNPEGIVIYHEAANLCFKKTIKDDAVPKSVAEQRRATVVAA